MPPVAANKASAEVAGSSTDTKAKVTPLGDFANIEEFTKNGFVEIVDTTKSVNAYPQGAARDLYCAYPSYGRIVDQQCDRILGLISNVLKWQNVKGNIQRRQQDEQFEMILECNDAMMERLNCNLDELAGIKKATQPIVIESRLNTNVTSVEPTGKGAGSWNLKRNEKNPMSARLITARNIARPQLKFKVPVDNSANKPFVPKLKDKPNSLKPLAILPEYDDAGNIASYLHPYEFELMKFEVSEAQLKRLAPQVPLDVNATELVYVDTVDKLQQALSDLRQHQEIAIDVEHHSYRTFLGFTCLIQISTRAKDYIFDALVLREELHILNEVLTNPKVVKILHGADLDIEWLQRDLSLYIVNMFDTHQAAKALNLARLSLSYLLKHYCDIEADKTFQLADWRIRPLPAELVAYARQDTHFLIYIYERISNDVLDAAHEQTNTLRTIYQRSTELCKKRYAKPVVGAESHLDFFRKSKRIFDNRQLYALREIYRWRDVVARLEDESYGYVLPNHMMLQIAESLPREMQGILACCNPIPPLVRQHMHVLHQIVLGARDQPLVKPILETDSIHRVAITSGKDFNSKLYCPHDLSHCEELRDDLPTLLDINNIDAMQEPMQLMADAATKVKMCKPKLSIFDTPEPSEDDESLKQQEEILGKIQFITPYQRYLAVLPLVEKEKREEAARLEAENKKRLLCPAANLLPVKKEVKEEAEEDNMYSVPVKEFLKRKYEESVAKKAAAAPASTAATSDELPKVKRTKTSVTPTDDKLNFANFPPSKKQQPAAAPPAAANKAPLKRKHNQTEVVVVADDDDDSDAPPVEMPSTSQVQTTVPWQPKQNHKPNKYKKVNKYKFNKAQQSSDKPVPVNFDYASVNFKKFQGGAQRAKGAELQPKFHGKGNANKANNKKFNKLFTFSNVKANKK